MRNTESLQKQLGRDAVIVGVLSGVRSEDRDRGRDEENLNPEEVAGRLERFRVSHGISHPMVMDIGGAFFENERGGRNNEGGYPAAVVSSDSIARWEGTVFDDAFRAALNRVINVDPGIRARRAAEEAYIRAKGG